MPEEGSLYHSRKFHMLALCVYVCTAEGAYIHACANAHVSTYAWVWSRRSSSVIVLTCDSASWCWISRCISLLPHHMWALRILLWVLTLVHKHYSTQALQDPSTTAPKHYSTQAVSPAHCGLFSPLLTLLTACEKPRAHASLFPTELEVLASLL